MPRRIIPLEHLDLVRAGQKLGKFVVQAIEIAKEDGIAEDRCGVLHPDHDPFIIWMTVDGVAVFRGSLVPEADESGFAIHAYGTWLPAYREFLPEPKIELTEDKPAHEPDADEWLGGKTDPDVQVN